MIVFLEPVPSPTVYEQAVARGRRNESHAGLPCEQQYIEVIVLVSSLEGETMGFFKKGTDAWSMAAYEWARSTPEIVFQMSQEWKLKSTIEPSVMQSMRLKRENVNFLTSSIFKSVFCRRAQSKERDEVAHCLALENQMKEETLKTAATVERERQYKKVRRDIGNLF
jgi:hypothetical protein